MSIVRHRVSNHEQVHIQLSFDFIQLSVSKSITDSKGVDQRQ